MTDARKPQEQYRVRLGAELRRLRRQANLSQEDLRKTLGISKTTLERIELGGAYGGAIPSVSRVIAWAQACSATPAELDLVRTLAEFATGTRSTYSEWGTVADAQDHARHLETTSMTMRNFSNWGIPGLLQTPEYATHVLRLADLWEGGHGDDAAAKRMQRQAILSDPRRHLEFIVTEGALRWCPGPVAVLQAQLAYLTAVAAWPTVTFGVIPDAAQASGLPMNPFVLFEDRLDGEPPYAEVELAHKAEPVSNPEEVALYRKLYGQLRETAIMGDDAFAIVRAVAASLAEPPGLAHP